MVRMRLLGLSLSLTASAACFDPGQEANDGGLPPTDAAPGPEPTPADGGAAVDASRAVDASAPAPDAAPPPGPPRYASCAQALPELLPAEPHPPESVLPQPEHCVDPDQPVLCEPEQGCPFQAQCLTPDPGAAGACLDVSQPFYLPTMLGYKQGECVMKVPLALKQAVCCAELPGFDCRGFTEPERASELGELCHVHEDCAPGLLCAATADTTWEDTPSGYGRCICPGVDPASVRVSPDCFHDAPPASWGLASRPLSAACVPALDEGFAVEVVARGIGNATLRAGQPGAAVDSQNRLHVVASDSALAHFVRSQGRWTRDVISETPGTGAFVQIDAHDTLHVVAGADKPGHPVYASDASGHWVVEVAGPDRGAQEVMLALDARGEPHLSFVEPDTYRSYYSSRLGAVFEPHFIGLLSTTTLVNFAGTLTWFSQDFDGISRGALTELGDVEFKLFAAGLGLSGVDASKAELLFVVTDDLDPHTVLYVAHEQEGALQRRAIWAQEDPRFVPTDWVHASVAQAPDGTVHVAHRAPSGVALHIVTDSEIRHVRLAPDGVAPLLVVDREGEPHVFYQALDEIRHAFRGSCP